MPAVPPPARWRLFPAVSVIALVLCVLMVALGWHTIETFGFRDPDDALRYVEARDFAAGQGWFDVSEHRVNPPVGGPMHWSRFVDLPISGLMLALRPLLGGVMADRIALALVPLLLTCALLFMVALAVRRLSGTLAAIAATGLICLSMPILVQFQPMRVDHHSWQILMAAIALWATFDARQRRGGIIAGLAVAFWTHVSSEGLPYAALFGGVYALAFIRDARCWDRVIAYALSLVAGAGALLLASRGWPDAANPYCDAISPVYLGPMAVAAITLPIGHRIIGSGHWLRRALIPAIAGLAAGIVYLAFGGSCLGGPFQTLDPVVYRYWYLHVAEGRPVWEQTPLMAAIVIVPPLIGMAGGLLARHKSHDADARFAWTLMLLIAAGTYLVSLTVMRALSISYVMALPGIAMLVLVLLPRAQGLNTAVGRVVATVALCGLTPLGVSVLAATILPDDPETDTPAVNMSDASGAQALPCTDKAALAGLAALPRGTILAPLDIGPFLLAFTPHSVIATPHHRNHLAMRDVILSFMGRPDVARAMIARHKVRYVAYCPGRTEVENYAKGRPASFMQALENGPAPVWLTPVTLRPGETIRVWRVTPQPPV